MGLGFTSCSEDEDDKVVKEAKILTFGFQGVTLGEGDVVIEASAVKATVPYGTDVTKLTPVVTVSEGAVVNPALGEMDFSSPVTLIVTNGDVKTTYSVTVDVAAPEDGSILTVTVEDALNNPIVPTAENKIVIEMYETADLTAIVPTIELSEGATVSPASGETVDFSNGAVTFTVSFGDETKEYMAEVSTVPFGFNNTSFIYEFTEETGTLPAIFTADGQRSAAQTSEYVFLVSKEDGGNIYYLPAAGGAGEFDETTPTLSKVGVEGGVWGLAHVRASGNTIVASNMSWDGGDWKIYKWSAVDADPEVILTYTTPADPSARFEYFEVEGDVNGDGAIYAMEFPGWNSVVNNTKVFKFAIAGGVVSQTPEVIELSDVVKAGNYGAAIQLPESDNIIVNGAEMTPAIYNTNGEQLAIINGDAIGKRTVGTSYFSFNGADYLAVMLCEDGGDKRQMLQIFDVTGDPVEAFNAITAEDTVNPGEGKLVFEHQLGDQIANGNIAGSTSVVVKEDKVLITALGTASGIVTVELTR
ncbi:uncharacterized protein DUF5018 [Sediminitomix flava]|uniref:Uncharacterized protein DUF5018 n=2 Tax=Sediminitomix flava TaxID=379075 RepID=A0A315ZF69_SEDFL|nr:uncharacterized protein DUF5018 [Sediminitomix flava]